MADRPEKLDLAMVLSESVRNWAMSDGCFCAIAGLVVAVETGVDENVQEAAESVQIHSETCGGCFENVWKTSETTQDRKKRRTYRYFLDRARIVWIRMNGGDCQIVDEPDGRRFLWKVPRHIELPHEVPFSGMEVFTPKDKKEPGWGIYDAASEEVFRNPGTLLQYLDETATAQVQRFDAATIPTLHWGLLVSDERFELKIRWQGQVKTLASGHTLKERYGKLLKKSYRENDTPGVDATATDEVLALHELAETYERDKSRFAGFVAQTLEYRRIDRARSKGKDPTAHADSIDSHTRQGDEQEDDSWLDRQRLRTDPWESELESKVQELDLQKQFDRLRDKLSPQERQILKLKRNGLSDEKVGQRMHLSRETVNRKFATIKRKAQELPK